MAIFRGTGGQGDSTTDTTVTTVTEKAAEAASSATSAANSATSANNSATSAETSATNAATSESNAATSATNASTSATAAETAKTAAQAAQTAAETAETNAETAETNAETAQAAAEAAQAAAETAQTNAETAETNAETAETNAETAYANTLAIFGDAQDVQDAVDDAEKLAVNPEDSQYTLSDTVTTGYSALHYAAKAEDSAALSQAGKNDAQTASDSAIASSTLAATYASNASDSADDAAVSASQALSYKNAAENRYDLFNDRFLGQITGDPDTDNNGDPLVTGALYFNTTENEIRVYTGSAWEPIQELSGDQTVNSLTSNNDVVVKGNLEVQGTTITVDSATAQTIDLGDNDRIRLGDSDDLQVYHDGSNSVIQDSGTGTLDISTNGSAIRLVQGNGNRLVTAGYGTAGVKLWYGSDDTEKLATTSTGVDVTGNITVSGTVDGRDVAADGTKLDGIEASADVTDTANVTAAGALMDSEVTNLAQVKAFDSADYATAAQGATADSALQSSGDTLTGDLAFGDNVKAKFGASDDLRIYHDEVRSLIVDQGTGPLRISATNLEFTNAGQTKFYASATDGGAFNLYHNHNQKLATTSSGVDITGTLVSDGATINGDLTITQSQGGTFLKFDVDGTQDEATLGIDATDFIISNDPTNVRFGSDIVFKTDGITAAKVRASGDFEFYEDTGTTAKLTWDASAEELQFKDNVKAEFGDGGDLELYSDGTNGIIKSSATQEYRAVSHSFESTTGGTTRAVIDSTGIDVTGTVTADDLLLNNGAGSSVFLQDSTGTNGYQIRANVSSSADFGLLIENLAQKDLLRIKANSDIVFLDDAGTSEDFYWDASTSRLGLGVTSPLYQLQLGGSSDSTLAYFRSTTDTAQIVIRDDDTTGYFGARNNFIYISPTSGTGADGLVVRTDTGNVGINNTNPTATLDVEGTIRARQGGSEFTDLTYYGIDFYRSFSYIRPNTDGTKTLSIGADSVSKNWEVISHGASNRHVFNIGASEAMRIDSSGNVGIGTTSPATVLHVENGASSYTWTPNARTAAIIEGNNFSGTTLSIVGKATGYSGIFFGDEAEEATGQINYEHTVNAMRFATAGAEKMRIDSAGRLGIGTTSPSTYGAPELVIGDSSDTADRGLTIASGSGYRGQIFFADGTSGTSLYSGYIQYDHPSNYLRFGTAGSEAARIDSSGNLLVGTTDSSLYNNTSGEGVGLIGGDHIEVATSGGSALFLNRMTSDGNIAGFFKDGGSIGNIGVDNTDNIFLSGNSTHSGLMVGTESIVPYSNGATTDATEDLGASSIRWRNLYLSGGVYLGGTGSANLLDDYEEGTWTPVVTHVSGFASTSITQTHATYTKVGRKVTLQLEFSLTDSTGNVTAGDDIVLTAACLPFSVLEGGIAGGVVGVQASMSTGENLAMGYAGFSSGGQLGMVFHTVDGTVARNQGLGGTVTYFTS